MINWLKKHFVPHQGNNFHPHFLRSKNTRYVIEAVILIELVVFILPAVAHLDIFSNLAAVLPATLSALTNGEREQNKLSDLKENSLLDKAANLKAQDMATKGYFAHVSPDGKQPWYWFDKAGYDYDYAGENLAVNFTDSQDVTTAWMNSPTHRANIVKQAYTEIGSGVAEGEYEGHQSTFVVQEYANPGAPRPALASQSK